MTFQVNFAYQLDEKSFDLIEALDILSCKIITSLIQVYNNICKMLESNANEQILTLQVAWKKMLA